MQRLANPFPQFHDQRGALLDAGHVYVGVAGKDPEVSPLTVYWDSGLTIVAEQPLRTLGGYIVNGSTPAQVYIGSDDYSLRVRDADLNQVLYAAWLNLDPAVSYQPLSEDLTFISELDTEPFGRELLTLTTAAQLKTAAGIVDGLPKTGGIVTGNITRSGSGVHLYHVDEALTSGRVFVTAAGAADPTSLPGDVWIELA